MHFLKLLLWTIVGFLLDISQDMSVFVCCADQKCFSSRRERYPEMQDGRQSYSYQIVNIILKLAGPTSAHFDFNYFR